MGSFEPKFYERQALTFLAKKVNRKLVTNFRIPNPNIKLEERVEIDGIFHDQYGINAIEVKSFKVDRHLIEKVLRKHKFHGFSKTYIISPCFDFNDAFHFSNKQLELVEFSPDFDSIWNWYSNWDSKLPTIISDSLQTGNHGFRYIMAGKSSKSKSFVKNQVDKKIHTIEKLKKDIFRFDFPPVKVLWSGQKWTYPKSLFYKKNKTTNLGGFNLVDIDGNHVHAPHFHCELQPGEAKCKHCHIFATKEFLKVKKLLSGFSDSYCSFFSGNKGIHIYISSLEDKLSTFLNELENQKVKIDFQVSRNKKQFMGFPTSLNASTMSVLEELKE